MTVLDIYDIIFIWKRERDVLKALVLAGGFPQIALIKELKERGYTVVLADYNENPVDRWCLGNASMESDSLGNVMAVKINNQAQRRIDGAVTLIILYEVFRRYRTTLYSKLQ